jgi:hypothetical protein
LVDRDGSTTGSGEKERDIEDNSVFCGEWLEKISQLVEGDGKSNRVDGIEFGRECFAKKLGDRVSFEELVDRL